MIKLEPVILQGDIVRLEPLQHSHAEDLYAASQEPLLWRYLSANPSGSIAEMHAWIATAQLAQQAGDSLPFAIVELATNRAVGSTRYHEVNLIHRGVEIGWTWLTPSVQRSGVNTEGKYLLLEHAFEKLGAIRVQLKTDSRNLQSQRAIERLQAIREGVLRNHMIMPDGHYRDSVYYSIIDTEWPTVKAGLTTKLQAYRQ